MATGTKNLTANQHDERTGVMEEMDPCTVDTAHCQDCGSTFLGMGEHGPACADCGGDLINQDDCEGGH